MPDRPTSAAGILRFDAFEIDLRTAELRKHGIRIKLRGQPQQILAMLLERPGEMISREEIRRRLWPADTFVDFEHSVNTAIKTLRQALGDSAEQPQFVETLPKLGYRFIAKVEAAAAQETRSVLTAAGTEAEPPSAPLATVKPRSGFARRWLAFAGALAVVVVAALTGLNWFRSRAGTQPATGRLMFAVLPFENLTGDSSQEYFSDGLTDEMIARLGQTAPAHIGVIARTSVMRYKRTQEPLNQVERELGVQYLLEGTVRRDADHVRISVRLIDASGQAPIWSRQYDRDVSSLLALQAEIADEIGNEIELTLGRKPKPELEPAAAESNLAPSASEAHDLYLKGLYSLNKRSRTGLEQAAVFFQQATAKDPSNARAYAGLADTYSLISSYNPAAPKENAEKARAAALRALELDDKLSEAHTALALIVESNDWDWQSAERQYQRAIELNPNYATAHQWYAEFLAFEGHFEPALAESERARKLDPLSLIIAADHAAILYYSRQYDRAIAEFRTVLDVEPTNQRACLIVEALAERGLYNEALAQIDKEIPVAGEDWGAATRAFVYARSGQTTQALKILKDCERKAQATGRAAPADVFAFAYAAAGDKDRAFKWLDQLYPQRPSAGLVTRVEPAFDPLRSDPRFQALLRRVRLAD